jgi:hypothetical protein
MLNFRPMFIFVSGERAGNAQVFATYKEAHDSAAARFMVWTQPEGFDVDETDDPVTYTRLAKRGDVSLRVLELEPDP